MCFISKEGIINFQSPEGFDASRWGPTLDGWYTDRGTWEVGNPSYGLGNPFNGSYCAGTVMNDLYDRDVDSRFISPLIILPDSPTEGKIWLCFWHWFSVSLGDTAVVEISLDTEMWEAVSDTFVHTSGGWVQQVIDISDYTGQPVHLAFHLKGNGDGTHSYGWFVDDIAIVEGLLSFKNPESFEDGTRGWHASNGVWQIGEPSGGPGDACEGNYCAGTSITDYYPRYTDSRLIGPPVILPESPQLSFCHWFSISNGDLATVEISVDGGEWEQIAGPFVNTSSIWSPYFISLSQYSNQMVRIAFHLLDNGDNSTSWGWYLDNIWLVGYPEDAPDQPIFHEVDYNGGNALLSWDNPVNEFQWIAIYAGTAEDFVPFLDNRIALVQGTSFLDEDRTSWKYFYKISAVNEFKLESEVIGPSVMVDVDEPDIDFPHYIVAKLHNNFPNPFNPQTVISFILPDSRPAVLTIFSVDGRVVRRLLDSQESAGHHEVTWNGCNDYGQPVASGTYFFRLSAGDYVETKRMALIR